MTCASCGGPIRPGELYIADVRHTEVVERRLFRTAITVKSADVMAAWHKACAPATWEVPSP